MPHIPISMSPYSTASDSIVALLSLSKPSYTAILFTHLLSPPISYKANTATTTPPPKSDLRVSVTAHPKAGRRKHGHLPILAFLFFNDHFTRFGIRQ